MHKQPMIPNVLPQIQRRKWIDALADALSALAVGFGILLSLTLLLLCL